MAATGKKSKKAKWIPASITDIIAEPTTIPAANNWADSVDDEPEATSYGGYSSRPRAPVVLPSASRAAGGGLAIDDESIPKRPPFIAHISNLPYDVDESAIADLFAGLKILSLRLPRESDRLKGYGYVDFEDRESLISAMNMPDLTISGRRIRIGVSTQENDRRMGRGGRNDRERDYDPERTMGDWRSGPRAVPEPQARGERERGPMERDSLRDRNRDRDRERESSADNRPGGWRDGERAAPAEPARTPYGGRDSFGRDRGFGEERGRERSGYGGRDGFRTAERDGFGSRDSRGFGSRGFGDRDRDPPKEDARPRERPKLNLLPRTVPRSPEPPAAGAGEEAARAARAAPKEKVFGAAKPVDTAAKEREIEERLLKQGEESRRAVDDKERWGRRTDHSGDRRGGARRDERDRGRDDRGRDSRSFNRDRRDYSKDGKDERRDYSKDDRERRDYRDDRDRRDYRDDRDRRDYRDERDRRDYKDDRERRDYRDDRDRRDYSGDRRNSRDGEDRERGRDPSRERDRRNGSSDRDDRDREGSRNRDRDGSRNRDRDGSRNRDRDGSRNRDRDGSRKRDGSRERDASRGRDPSRGSRNRDGSRTRDGSGARDGSRSGDERPRESNGRARESRSRDRYDERDLDDKPLPKMKEQEKPNFVASNKFSFLEDADDGASD